MSAGELPKCDAALVDDNMPYGLDITYIAGSPDGRHVVVVNMCNDIRVLRAPPTPDAPWTVAHVFNEGMFGMSAFRASWSPSGLLAIRIGGGIDVVDPDDGWRIERTIVPFGGFDDFRWAPNAPAPATDECLAVLTHDVALQLFHVRRRRLGGEGFARELDTKTIMPYTASHKTVKIFTFNSGDTIHFEWTDGGDGAVVMGIAPNLLITVRGLGGLGDVSPTVTKHTIPGLPDDTVRALTMSPDGRFLAVGHRSGVVCLVDLERKLVDMTLWPHDPSKPVHGAFVNAWSRETGELACAATDATITLYARTNCDGVVRRTTTLGLASRGRPLPPGMRVGDPTCMRSATALAWVRGVGLMCGHRDGAVSVLSHKL